MRDYETATVLIYFISTAIWMWCSVECNPGMRTTAVR